MKKLAVGYALVCLVTFVGGFATTIANAQGTQTMHQIDVVEQSLHKLTWLPPLERENGDPLAEEDIVGYKVERLDDSGNVLETVELDGSTLELAITIVPMECMVYKAYAIATDGSPTSDPQGTLESKPTDAIRICVIPPKKPRDFQVQ